jgi:hypothetical protein
MSEQVYCPKCGLYMTNGFCLHLSVDGSGPYLTAAPPTTPPPADEDANA